ncbi:MAG TPA: imidazolonepropionase [Chitinophagales bacterium]|nr:imidazolonepropionase [Chitinophagales bacterium]
MASILFRNIKQLVGTWPNGAVLAKGPAMKQLPYAEDAFLLAENGIIKSFGPDANAPERADLIIDATSRFVIPCWCDSHTHIVYAAPREAEFVDKIKGLTYEEIARRGGGILNSAKRMATASEEELFDAAWQRLEEMQGYGTGAVEIKSGYGLSYEGELKMLRVMKRLKEKSKLTIKANFLGAHAYPQEFKENHRGYLDLLINKLLPVIAAEGLADFVDVFCDKGFFSADETNEILEAAAKYNLRPKIHANELGFTGGIETGVKNNALSVDHLEFTGDEQIQHLLNSGTMPTLLPSTAFFLGLEYAPARKMIDAGLPVALASDFNPGSSPSGNLPLVLSISCTKMKMLPEEAVTAATLNSAYAMGVEGTLGSITVGKKANLILTKPMPSLAYLPYSFGSNLVEKTFIQ